MGQPTNSFSYSLILIIAILVACGLRLYQLDAQSLWYDEGVTAIVAQYDPATLIRWTADDIQPPLYYLLVSAWGRLAGWSEWSLRFPSLFFGVLLVPLMAVLTRRLTQSPLAAHIAAWITALHPLLLYYSQEARMYTMLVALGVLAGYCLLRAARSVFRREQRLAWIGYILAAATAIYTHYFAIFLLLALTVAYLLDGRGLADDRRQTTDDRQGGAEARRRGYADADNNSPRNTQHATRFTFHVSRFSTHPLLITHYSLFFANLTIFLLFLPWLSVLVTRLRVDTSYWEGTLKLWEALRAIAIRFTVGETVLEAEAIHWLWLYAAVTVVIGCWLLVVGGRSEEARRRRGEDTRMRGYAEAGDDSSRNTQHATRTTHHAPRFTVHASHPPTHPLRITHYSLFWLLLPIAAVLLLASITPKFNPRYAMVALPGLILLWSSGLAALLAHGEHRATQPFSNLIPNPWSLIPRLIGLIMLIALISGFFRANVNWFTDRAFTKDQWREVAAHVRSHREVDDAPVLVSGHAWPIWQYYAPDMPAIRLPEIEILDVNAVLDFTNTADPLRRGVQGSRGVWLIGWQDEVVDPMGIVPLQLARAGEEERVEAGFWGLTLRRFAQIESSQISAEPPIQIRVDANYGDLVHLRGYTVDPQGDLLLFWHRPDDRRQTIDDRENTEHAPRTSHHDLHLSGETLNAGRLLYADIADRRLSAYAYPFFRWQPGQVTVGRIPAREWAGAGAAPGNYQVRLGVYDPAGDPAGLDLLDANGDPLGKWAALEVTLTEPTTTIIGENPFSWDQVAPGLYADVILSTREVEPGQPVSLSIGWWTAHSLADVELILAWQQNGVQVAAERLPVAPTFPPVTWEKERFVRTLHQVRTPLDLEAGEYRLVLSVADRPGEVIERVVEVQPSSRLFSPPPLALSLGQRFGEEIALLGTGSTVARALSPGRTLKIEFVWQAERVPAADYAVTVQWLDASGRPVAQRDEVLTRGSTTWLAGEVVTQPLTVQAPVEPGAYRLIAAVYDPLRPGLPRLPVNGDSFIQIAEISVK
jgi:hypothetical protein